MVPSLSILQTIRLTPNFILYILLPTLIFDAAINLDARELMRNIVPIFLLAAPGVLLATAVTGLLVAKFTVLGLNAAMLFGALISTTDTAAGIALFNELNAPKRLAMLMDGESLFNDATAIVTFDIIAAIVAASLLLPNPADAWSASTLLNIPGKFLLVFFGGALVGAAVGWVLMQIIRFANHDPLIEVGLTTVVAYAAFIVANHYVKVSSVKAGLWVLLVHWCRPSMGERTGLVAARILVTQTTITSMLSTARRMALSMSRVSRDFHRRSDGISHGAQVMEV